MHGDDGNENQRERGGRGGHEGPLLGIGIGQREVDGPDSFPEVEDVADEGVGEAVRKRKRGEADDGIGLFLGPESGETIKEGENEEGHFFEKDFEVRSAERGVRN